MATSCTTNLALSPDPCNARYIILVCKKSSRNQRENLVKGTNLKYSKAAAPTQKPPRSYRKRYSARVVVVVPDLPPDHLDRLGHTPGTVVSRLDKLFRVHQPNLQTRRDPQRAHRTGRSAEQVPFFFVVRSEPYDLPVSENHLHLSDRVVEEAVLEAGGFPCRARESAAGGDAWELHHYRGDQAVGEGSFDQLVHWDVWFHEGGFGCFVDG
ncbi:hypothetical protein QC762_0067320 [Podospora pseudocomata]|uniref:Uncharacterized protein n=1 Tax=Podospora pseudocomata TaxID=2093779 RepID=A0ABR0GFS6_9PEZI|nr:hypothetical protein QC762_0067320 [Podospora pseudocomata]